VFISGETLSAHIAHLRKILRWIVLVHEDFSVNKGVNREKKIEFSAFGGFLSVFFFSKCTFDFQAFHLKKLKIICYYCLLLFRN